MQRSRIARGTGSGVGVRPAQDSTKASEDLEDGDEFGRDSKMTVGF